MSDIRIININWNYRKCDHCWRKGKEHWMHGHSKVTNKTESVSGHYCSKHDNLYKEKVIKIMGEGAL